MFHRLLGCTLAGLLALATTAAAAPPDVEALRGQLRGSDPAAQAAALEEAARLGAGAAALSPDIARLLDSSDLALRLDALTALGKLGSAAAPAAPAVAKLLDVNEPLLQQQALITLREIGSPADGSAAAIDRLMQAPDRALAVDAAATSVALSRQASPKALDVLLQALSDGRPGVRSTAVYWLAASGADLTPRLIELLQSGALATRISVAELLGELGSSSAAAVEALAAQAAEQQPTLQATVARSLGKIGEHPEIALPALVKLAGSDLANVRGQAVLALGRFGRRAAGELDLLQSRLKDAEPAVRMAAAEALANLGPAAAAAGPALTEALKDAEGAVTIRAAEALGRIGGAGVNALAKLLDDPHYGLLALQSLESMGAAARPAVPKLLELLKQEDGLPQRDLCLAVAAAGAPPRVAGPVLREIAGKADSPARAAAIYALGRIGDTSAIKLITNAVEDDDPRVQLASSWALLQLDPGNEEHVKIAVPRLIQALSRPEAPVRLEAARTLGSLGPKGAAAQGALLERLATDDERLVRIASAMAVAEFGDAAASAVPALSELVQGTDPQARRAALFALGRIGSPAAAAGELLKAQVQSGHAADRALAAWALLRVRSDAGDVQTALPVVLSAIAHERPEVVVPLVLAAGRVGKSRPEVQRIIDVLKSSEDPALRAAAWTVSDEWSR
jgi:HEAT repeat protein